VRGVWLGYAVVGLEPAIMGIGECKYCSTIN
jgi:hypothetical protein